MGVSKIQLDGNSLIDLTADTVAADKLLQGYTAHNSNGDAIVGTYSGGSEPTGTININENGVYNVSEYAFANVNMLSYKTASGTYSDTSGHNSFSITHNLNSKNLILFVQARDGSSFSSQYQMIGGVWISEEMKQFSGIFGDATYAIPYSTSGITSIDASTLVFGGRATNSPANASKSYYTTPSTINTTVDGTNSNLLECTNFNTVKVYTRYATKSNVIYDWKIYAF